MQAVFSRHYIVTELKFKQWWIGEISNCWISNFSNHANYGFPDHQHTISFLDAMIVWKNPKQNIQKKTNQNKLYPNCLFSGMHIGWLLSEGFHGIPQSEISHGCQLWKFCTPLCILANYPKERHFPTVTWPYSHHTYSVSWRLGD